MRTRERRGGAVHGLCATRVALARDRSEGTMPPGDLLSCYTASVARYLAGAGVDAELAVGAQLYLAVRFDPGGGLAFVHQHTPLRGDCPTHHADLVRRSSHDPDRAVARILAERRRAGAVVIAGDVAAMPWQGGDRHAPHWLVVDDVNELAGTAHVQDPLAYEAEHGEQEPYSGWVPIERLASLCRPPGLASGVWTARDAHAFGDLDGSPGEAGPHQWFEAVHPPTPRRAGVAEALALLRDTWAHHAGLARRPDLPAPEWRWGVEAIQGLAGWFEPRLADPAAYEVADDLWVAARNRSLFARVVGRLAGEPGLRGLRDVAQRAAELSDEWAGLPRMLAYNAQSVARGRAPRSYPVAQLRRIADLEGALLDELGSAVGAGVAATATAAAGTGVGVGAGAGTR